MNNMKSNKGKEITAESRHGRHHPDKVQFGGMVTPEFKAIAQMTANKLQCSLMELMQRGVDNLATGVGILKNGKITKQYKEAVDSMADIIRTKLSQKRKGI